MTRFQHVLIGAVGLMLAASVQARDYAIALSPWQEPETAKAQAAQLLEFIIGLEGGDSALLVDGYAPKTTGRFVIPEGAVYAHPRARLNKNGKAVAALQRFTSSVRPAGSDDAPKQGGALRLPHLLRHIAANRNGDGPLDVLVIGSALFDDPKEPEFSMAGGLIPGDGHLSQTRAVTPYGAKGQEGLLGGMRLYMVYGDDLASDQHAHYTLRFWTLFMEAQGGMLAAFSSDAASVLARFGAGAGPLPHRFKRKNTDKLEMIRLRRLKVQQSLYERPVSTQRLAAKDVRRAENVEVGITWGCKGCDLDLHVRPMPGAQVLSWRRTKTPEGTFFKDYRKSPELSQGRETIAFHVPLDLRSLRLAVNFYSGAAPKGRVSGELRLAASGRTYAYPFEIAARTGNFGSGVGAVMSGAVPSSAHTLLIDPLPVVGERAAL